MKTIGRFFISLTLLLPILLWNSSCGADAHSDNHLQEYFDLLNQHPKTLGPIGDASKGEIEIVLNPRKIQEIEKQRNVKVGIVHRDRFWVWIRDAVLFPSGSYGTYNRMLWVSSLQGIAGVAVVPMTLDGKFVLIRNYRHATRSWEYEVPRGNVSAGETAEQAAIREVQEETGLRVKELKFVGFMQPDSGLVNTKVAIFVANVEQDQNPNPEDSEAIDGIVLFSRAQIAQGYKVGYILKEIAGEMQPVSLRDPFLTYGIALMAMEQFL